MTRTCERCGAQGSDGELLTWCLEPEQAFCPECARAHVRDIEAKLPTEWW
jgi:hypothetical protein